ncbi:MAG: carbohydrate ABC transporter permease [Clostridiales bacterium]|nr:carbohydrate ABC transporter permease [Clostridiales bacterium]
MAKTKKRKKIKIFPIINGLFFVIVCLFILVPMWKVFVDSIDRRTSYGMRLWPKDFGLEGYKVILTYQALYKPFLVSCITTIAGTFVGLTLSTLGAYVLIQFEMPGRNLFSFLLLFTMIFSGGMIPSFLVMQKLNLIDTLWAVILPLGMNVYNLVLMRNFFEGIPSALFEAAAIDGCTPIGIFFKIVLPLSKAALASIGLMFSVAFWNDYTNFKIYIQKSSLYNFQQKLRNLIMDGDTPSFSENIAQSTLTNAAVMVAIIPFMIIYPFCQKYFVKGVNIGGVKE